MKALCVLGVGRALLMSGQPALIKIHWKSDGPSKHMINQHPGHMGPHPMYTSILNLQYCESET